MGRTALFLMAGAAVIALGGCSSGAELAIRAKPTGLAQGEQPASFRVAEARGHFALGNVALALEGFRKALREDDSSVDAMNGIAACYDRMGRFDLSRRYYEMALATAPGDPRLYANLALSLDLQGRRDEAASVRAEMGSRIAAAKSVSAPLPAAPATPDARLAVAATPRSAPVPLRATEPAIVDVRAVALAPAPVEVGEVQLATAELKPTAPAAVMAPAVPRSPPSRQSPEQHRAAASVSVALAPAPQGRSPGPYLERPRLERLSLGEVALVTSGPVQWKARVAEHFPRAALAGRSTLQPAPVIRLTLLNAARSEGLAARTRALLQRQGFAHQRIAIGNAAQAQRSSTILYPAGQRSEALRLASQFGFALRHRPGSDNRLIVVLGRDAVAGLGRRRG